MHHRPFELTLATNVTLDPETAHPLLVLSEDSQTVRHGDAAQELPDNPERFDQFPIVLGQERFTSGRHFWEIDVGTEEGWGVGVARKSARKTSRNQYAPEEGLWHIGKWKDDYRVYHLSDGLALTPREKSKRIRVNLNCEEDGVAFYDAESACLLFERLDVLFSRETFLPFFYVARKGGLKLSP
ncbi:thaicobrin-like [Rhineura floridana]|uniref:thaicobrin-like n=1 Tax=Rhineura floridana TaxID=261503 RepID=UPI002AC81E3F|nr:thaicobrin-like [Rhineura floridana]